MEYLQYYKKEENYPVLERIVLNLVISGIPSIQEEDQFITEELISFKPCYKWNTFNTENSITSSFSTSNVLNLVISGIPSILKHIAY